MGVSTILAHGNNLDEALFIGLPLLAVVVLVVTAWRRSRELEAEDG